VKRECGRLLLTRPFLNVYGNQLQVVGFFSNVTQLVDAPARREFLAGTCGGPAVTAAARRLVEYKTVVARRLFRACDCHGENYCRSVERHL
jgi:hypothetical protein